MTETGGTTGGSFGVAFTPFETRASSILEVARLADRLGFAQVTVAEAMSLSAPVVLAEVAMSTERVELGAGVLSVWSRTPATLALTAAQLQELSGGRFVLGLGASTAPLVEGLHGVPWQRPLHQLRKTVTAVRALLAGERLPDAPPGARPLRLSCPPRQPVPIGLAAITPPSIRLAGGLADRWLPFLLSTQALDDGREELEHGRRDEDRQGLPSVTACVPLAVAADEAGARALAARWLVTYCRSMGPVYPRVVRSCGYGQEVDALLEANTGRSDPVLPPTADRLAHDLLVFGTYDDARDASLRWTAHADTVLLGLPFNLPPEELVASLRSLAPPQSTASG